MRRGLDGWLLAAAVWLPGCVEAPRPVAEFEAAQDGEAAADSEPADSIVAADARPTMDAGPMADAIVDAFSAPDAAAPLHGCPIAVAPAGPLEAVPGEWVRMPGDASRAGAAPIVRWAWTVVEAPAGSLARATEGMPEDPRRPQTDPPDDPATASAGFAPDRFGRYRLALEVTDADGQTAPSDDCPQAPAEVVVDAPAVGQGLQIELSWTTAGDPDPHDLDGTDVDLHLLHPSGQNWAQAPLDCYYANAAPDWGRAGPEGNPSLDVDDVNGWGPETITLETPENTDELGAPYLVGVDYYRADNFAEGRSWGPSEMRVRIFVDGVLTHDASEVLLATHEWWIAAEIHWPQRRVVPRHDLHRQAPGRRADAQLPRGCPSICAVVAGCSAMDFPDCQAQCAATAPAALQACVAEVNASDERRCVEYAACFAEFEPSPRTDCANACEFRIRCGADLAPRTCVADCVEADAGALGVACRAANTCETAYVCEGLVGSMERVCVDACVARSRCPDEPIDEIPCAVQCTAGVQRGWLDPDALVPCIDAAECAADRLQTCVPMPAAPAGCVNACDALFNCERAPFASRSGCFAECGRAVVAGRVAAEDVVACVEAAQCAPQRAVDCIPNDCDALWIRVEACAPGLFDRGAFYGDCLGAEAPGRARIRCIEAALEGPNCPRDLRNCRFL